MRLSLILGWFPGTVHRAIVILVIRVSLAHRCFDLRLALRAGVDRGLFGDGNGLADGQCAKRAIVSPFRRIPDLRVPFVRFVVLGAVCLGVSAQANRWPADKARHARNTANPFRTLLPVAGPIQCIGNDVVCLLAFGAFILDLIVRANNNSLDAFANSYSMSASSSSSI